MHKQGEVGSPLCKVLPVKDYIYRGETKKDRYSARYEWLQSLQSIPEGTQSCSTKFFSMRSVVFLHERHAQWPQLSTMRNIVPVKEYFQLTSLVFFFFLLYKPVQIMHKRKLQKHGLHEPLLENIMVFLQWPFASQRKNEK